MKRKENRERRSDSENQELGNELSFDDQIYKVLPSSCNVETLPMERCSGDLFNSFSFDLRGTVPSLLLMCILFSGTKHLSTISSMFQRIRCYELWVRRRRYLMKWNVASPPPCCCRLKPKWSPKKGKLINVHLIIFSFEFIWALTDGYPRRRYKKIKLMRRRGYDKMNLLVIYWFSRPI